MIFFLPVPALRVATGPRPSGKGGRQPGCRGLMGLKTIDLLPNTDLRGATGPRPSGWGGRQTGSRGFVGLETIDLLPVPA